MEDNDTPISRLAKMLVAKQPEEQKPPTVSSLDAAFREFAKPQDPLSAALKDFAAQTPTSSPPPYSPSLASVDTSSHMKTALSYIEDIATASEKLDTIEGVWPLLEKVATAAQHVSKAQQQDPTSEITAYTKKGEPYRQSQDDLSARLLSLEGHLSAYAARMWPGRGSVDSEGYRLLQRAMTATEGALRYRPNDPDYLYQLAGVFKLLGQKEAALDAAKKALAINRSHIPSIKFIDASGGEWAPLWKDGPSETIPKEFPIKTICFGGGGIIFLIGANSVDPLRATAVIIALCLFAFGFFKWRHERGVEQSYREYESARLDGDIKKLTRELHKDRYDREKEERAKR